MKLDRYEKDFHLKLQNPKEPQLTHEFKTVVSQTGKYFQLWHGTANEPIAGNKIDEEEMRNLFGQEFTHIPPREMGCTSCHQVVPVVPL